MTVKRIIVDIAASDVAAVSAFYQALFDLSPVMNQDWIVTLASGGAAPLQISIASEGGSGAPPPDMTIEVEDIDAIHAKATALAADIVYDITDEPWAVRRFFLRDPAGKLVNVMAHIA